MKNKELTSELTRLDVLKTILVLIMVVDHVGAYFFPEHVHGAFVQWHLWFRAIGRVCVPAWLFLIGYANTREVGTRIWAGTLILVAGNIISGMYILPLNILATIAVTRLWVDDVAKSALKNAFAFWGVALALAALSYPSQLFMEYGTLGLMMGVFGWLCRRRDEIAGGEMRCRLFGLYALVAYTGLEAWFFGMDSAQTAVMGALTAAMMFALYRYAPGTFPQARARIGNAGVGVLQFMGRRTLEIYVVHLMLFKFMNMYLSPQDHVFLHPGFVG